MRRLALLLVAAVPLALLALLAPVSAEELGPPPEAAGASGGGGEGGFHGFSALYTHALGQVANTIGFLNAFREDNRLVGAVSEINGPPASSRNIAAFVLRGPAATFVYGSIGSSGGARGTLPDPPPGEADAFYPAEPLEMTFEGPVTGAVKQQVVDGRFHAKATEVPTGQADAAATKLDVPGQFKVEQATVVSHTEPAEGGLAAESVSVLRGITAGPLQIESLVSRAYAFVPSAPGEPKGMATTVVEGATVNGTPVKITSHGVVVGDQVNPLNQGQINDAFKQAGFGDVRLLESFAAPGENNESVSAAAGGLQFAKQDEAFGAANPQGFSGGGFALGGAEAAVLGRRCHPACAGAAGAGGVGDLGAPTPVDETAPPPAYTGAAPAGETELPAVEQSYAVDTGGAYASTGTPGVLGGTSGGTYDTGPSVSTAVTPRAPATVSRAPGGQRLALASRVALGPREANWVRDLYLALAGVLGLVFVGRRLVRAL